MSLEELMRQFAALVGEALARRWWRRRGPAPPPAGDPGTATGGAAAESQGRPSRPSADGTRD